jgi:hypothetical protein
LFGLMSSCQFFWIVTCAPVMSSDAALFRASHSAPWDN